MAEIIGTADGAQQAANRIMEFWGIRGYVVKARSVSIRGDVEGSQVSGFGVRSDMINGWPREIYELRQRAMLA